MDADNAPARKAAPAQGGTVEPANRAPVAIAKFQTPAPEPGEELLAVPCNRQQQQRTDQRT